MEKTGRPIESLQDANLDILCRRLSKLASKLTTAKNWPAEQLAICADYGVFKWLVAAKGAGFVDGHPVGLWYRQALFFLVWSCPQGVQEANLCEFANITD